MLPVIYSDEFLEHKTGRLHPECPERLIAITTALKSASFASEITWRSPTSVHQRPVISLIEEVHTKSYIKSVEELASSGGGFLDTDTAVSPRSYDVALLAVNAWIDGVDTVLETEEPAFVLARPPGHHAEKDYGMGFCLFGNAAIAAFYALKQPGISRVAILDWDVHHGNGTQALVQENPNIAYCSLHQFPCYPGTGKVSDRGSHSNVLNLPIPPESDITIYQPLFDKYVVNFLTDFQPDLLIISAGYDANADDPLARINLQPQDYGLFTEYCLGITRRILFGLEGGYDFAALSESVLATIEKCLI
jgi:acetoin utilization deacetylase AcuC-like enzyme